MVKGLPGIRHCGGAAVQLECGNNLRTLSFAGNVVAYKLRMSSASLPVAVERLDLENTSDRAQAFLHKQRYDFALARISGDDSALEIGTGTGYFSEILCRHCSYTGLEIDAASCDQARQRVNGRGQVVEGDAQSQPFPANSYSRIIALEVLEHVPNYRKAVAEIHRCLKRDGTVIISVPYRRIGGKNPANPYHVYEPGAGEMIRSFQQHFTNVEVFYQTFPETLFMTIARVFHLRRFLGLAQTYADLANGIPSVLKAVKIDSEGRGMRLTLVLVASGKR